MNMKRNKLLLTLCIIFLFVGTTKVLIDKDTTIAESATKVKISQASLTLAIGDKPSLEVLGATSAPIWASSNTSVAEVKAFGNYGIVTAVKKGKATITATIGSTEYKCKITVTYPTIIVDPKNTSTFNNGKFEGWGTSLAWWGNRIGYSDKMNEKAAKLLYGEDGLSLDILRYNIGGGDDPTHHHITRADADMPGYLVWNESKQAYEYDWNKDANQRNSLLKILKVNKNITIEAFANSAPYFMTVSGCTSGSVDGKTDNLKEGYFDDFANYLADVTLHYKNDLGINFTSVSAMNEPTSGWAANSTKQEGSKFTAGATQSKMLLELSKSFTEKGLKDVLITASDETSVNTQVNSINMLSDDAKQVVDRIDTHTYSASDGDRDKLKKLAEQSKKGLWMSETDGSGTYGTNGASSEMEAGLWFANLITKDMNELKPSAWAIWQAIANYYSSTGTPGDATSMLNTKSGYWGVAVADIDKQDIVLTQKYYVFGQYTKYIKPGYTILNTIGDAVTAYDKSSKTLVIVAINKKADTQNYDFDLSKFKSVGSSVDVIRTSGSMQSGEHWKKLKSIKTSKTGFTTKLKAYSITTFIIKNVKM